MIAIAGRHIGLSRAISCAADLISLTPRRPRDTIGGFASPRPRADDSCSTASVVHPRSCSPATMPQWLQRRDMLSTPPSRALSRHAARLRGWAAFLLAFRTPAPIISASSRAAGFRDFTPRARFPRPMMLRSCRRMRRATTAFLESFEARSRARRPLGAFAVGRSVARSLPDDSHLRYLPAGGSISITAFGDRRQHTLGIADDAAAFTSRRPISL